MKLSQFTDLLQSHSEKPFHLVLRGSHVVPVSFHITEVGHMTKKFIDCGGKVHTAQSCQLQAWVWTDTESSTKMRPSRNTPSQATRSRTMPSF